MAPRTAGTALVLALAGAVLVGCSAGSASSSGGASMAAPQPAVAGDSAVGVAAGTGSSVAGEKSAPLSQVVVGRSVIVRADVAVRVDDVPASTARLSQLAAARGAEIASQSTSDGEVPAPVPVEGTRTTDYCAQVGCGTSATSVTTLRIAGDKVDLLLADVRALGTVTWSQRSADDVSTQVADVDARVASARASVARLRALMARATTLADVVSLEAEVSRRQADLESLEAQQRVLADQTALATVTVTLTSQVVAPVEESSGFLAGLRAGWGAFTSALVGALTVLGALVPFLVVGVPVVLLVLWWVRRQRSRGAVRSAPTASEG